MAKVQQTKGPYYSKAWIQQMWEFTNQNFVDFDTGAVDFEALGREEFEFRKAMFFRNFKNSKRAEDAFNEAKVDYDRSVNNGSKGGRPRKDSQSEPSSSDKKPEQLVYGEQENVFLTQDEYNSLATRMGNVNELKKVVNGLSNALADGSKKSANHYATLCSWIDYRKEHPDSETGNSQHYETVSEHNRRVYLNGLAQLEEMKKNGRFG